MTSPSLLKLIGPTMFRAFRCVWMLEELGVAYQQVPAKPWSKTAKQYHPQGKIPILVDGDFVLYESTAINTYLGDTYQNQQNAPPLVPPPNTRQRALYNQYTLAIISDMDTQGLWIHRKHDVLSEYFGKSPVAVEEAKRQFHAIHQVLVKKLSQPGPYLLGNDFTAIDILYIHCLDWASSIGWLEENETSCDDKNDHALTRYLRLCKSRPAYQRTLAKRTAEEAQMKEEKQRSKI